MKTTIELPDDLVIAAKKRAAELRRPLRALVEEGLRRRLREGPLPAHRRSAKPIAWVTVDGGLPAGLDLRSRAAMHAWIAADRSTTRE